MDEEAGARGGSEGTHPDDAKRARIRLYQETYLSDRGFEAEMIRARQRLALEVLAQRRPTSVVEIGCGTDPLYERSLDLAPTLRRWVIVEPGDEFVRTAEQARSGEVELSVIHGFFEEKAEEVGEALGGGPDLTLCLGVLQSVRDPVDWLGIVRRTMDTGSWLLVGVPNALSFHRRLAKAMGLIRDERELSERDRQRFHHRVFDLEELGAVVDRSGFRVEDGGGYLIKPFTHAQMERMGAVVTPEILDGLWKLGRTMPDLASEIYVTAEAV